LSTPFSLATLKSYVPSGLCQDLIDELNRMTGMGVAPAHIAYTLNLLAAERTASQQICDRVELVWTGQEVIGSESRDTAVVVRELFSTARQSVLISSFAIDRGEKVRVLFAGLASRMDANPSLQVRMFSNVQRPHGSNESESALLKKFADTFRRDIWAGNRLPEVFYDPRSLVSPFFWCHLHLPGHLGIFLIDVSL
jgi:hypothetical protein